MKKLIAVAGLLALAQVAEAKTIGIWTDHRTGLGTGLTNTLEKAGWEIEWFKRSELEDAEKLAKTDVMFFGGGWGCYYFPSPKSRLNLIRYAASGKGILLSGFRSGYVRTANRSMFPEIGEVYNRVQSAWISPEGKSPLAKAFGGRTVAFGGNDHLCVRVGEKAWQHCAMSSYFHVKLFPTHIDMQP